MIQPASVSTAPGPALNLVLVGPMGAGKSSVGRALAARLGRVFVDTDAAVEQGAGASIAALFEREGEAGFRVREREVLAGLLAGDGLVIATGGGAVLDAGTRRALRARGRVVHLHADLPTQLRRLAGDSTRPLLARPDREAVLHRLAAERAPLYAEVADLAIDTSALGPDEVLALLDRWLATDAPEPSA